MRCFVAAWPFGAMLDLLEGHERPAHPGLRWTTPHQWHVTLRFLGDVPETDGPALVAALGAALTGSGALIARAGPATAEIAGQLVVPVAGLDDLAVAVTGATAPFGDAPERRRFQGHLTLARARRRTPIPRELLGRPFQASWSVDAITVVRSHLEPTGARYEDIGRVDLTAGGRG